MSQPRTPATTVLLIVIALTLIVGGLLVGWVGWTTLQQAPDGTPTDPTEGS